MLCSYCGQENSSYAETCSFCEAPLKVKRPKLNGFMYLELCERPFSVLVSFHTYDLLVLLRLVREKRTSCYHLMRTVQKAPDGVVVPSDIKGLAENEYRLYTSRMKVIEGILVDRMGYKPKRIDNKLLEKFKEKIERD
ncbi:MULTISPECIES: hypothetical protein [unclassified Niallia]|uniref:hypothetical protein n=1 Tax=unclassified Niallia TaxID=2837522 RepID=UPI0030F6792D